MRRREFIALLGGTSAAAAWPRVVRAERIARVGYLGLTSATSVQATRINAFREGLHSLGYVEGKNIQIEFRFAGGDNGRLPGLAAELIGLKVDVIVTYATGVSAARRMTTTIPIVMATFGDAVATGVVANLAHPGGNITGSTFFSPELTAKRLELLKEVLPSVIGVGVLLIRDNEMNGPSLEVMEGTAKALGVELEPFEVRGPVDFESAFSAWTSKQIGAVVVGDHAFLVAGSDAIAALAAKHRLPSIGPLELAASGGLMAYGVNFSDMFRRAAVFVDKILKGTRPGDIPVEQAAKIQTIVNRTTAKALGIDVPTTLLLRADEVIE
jgi:putative tryptophan/tyrosine transport system substrate-binding protein